VKEILLELGKLYPQGRFWEMPAGQAYAKFSVVEALKIALNGNLMAAMKKLIIINYGKKGHPDISGCLMGVWVGIEAKTGRGKQNENQVNFEKTIKSCGGFYIVVDNHSPVREQIIQLDKVVEFMKRKLES
jgi:hypothetical protein